MHNEIKGLTEKKAEELLLENGKNELQQKKAVGAGWIFLSQFKDLMSVILAIATVLSAVLGEVTDAVTILSIVLLNAVMGFIQEYRTERTMEALAALSAPVARVYRDGKLRQIPADDLVEGDVVKVSSGDRIAADGICKEVVGVSVDEAMLTGESLAVDKKNSESLYMGTSILAGHCEMLVTKTGMQTEMGKIAGMLDKDEEEPTPLQVKLNDLGKVVAVACIIICAAVSAIGWLNGEDAMTMLLTGISLSVAAIPEGLPAIVTIVLALSVGRILKKGAIIRRLHAVETLGCAGVICTDKTGTITQNKMTVRRIWFKGKSVELTEKGKFTVADKEINIKSEKTLEKMLEYFVICSSASLEKSGKSYKTSGLPTETALLVAAAKGDIYKEKISYSKLSENPFDSTKKMMSVTIKRDGVNVLICKGAPDILLKKCSRVITREGIVAITPAVKAEINSIAEDMAKSALRVIAVAEGTAGGEENLVFVGLAGMLDPPRPEVAAAVRSCIGAGIKPVMITGDHKTTARAIAQEVGIYKNGDQVVTGEELTRMSEKELVAICRKTSVYARVSPADKLRIVKAYKAAGQIVAMTGDGVNDAPAVKAADIGVAMGKTGTDVTKEASSVIILDDNFATIVSAVEEGRVIYKNIRGFIRYLLTCNLGEVLSMFFSLLLGAPVALLPIQILMVNLLTDGLPAIALGMEPPTKDVMSEKPRPKNKGLFADGLMMTIIIRGIFLGMCTSGVFYYVLDMSGELKLARSAGYLVLVLSQMVHIFECRGKGFRLWGNPYLLAASVFSIAVTLLTVYNPWLQTIFGTTAVTSAYFIPVAVGVFAGPILFWIIRIGSRPFRR